MWKYLLVLMLFLISCKFTAKKNNESFIAYPSCNESKGRVEDYPYPPANMPWEKTKVYLPPCYDNTKINYPVLYLIHGAGGNPTHWLNMGLVQIMDRLIETKAIKPYIVVMTAVPKIKINGAMYEGWYTKKEWFTKKLIPGIDAAFRTNKNRLYRGVGGASQGGAISGLFGWKHPELIGSIGLYGAVQSAGGYMPGWKRRSPELSKLLNKVPEKLTPHVYIDVGRNDGLSVANLSLTLHLRERLMPYILYTEEGTHANVYWGGHLEEYLRWFDSVFGKPASRLQKTLLLQQTKKKSNKNYSSTKGTHISIQINHPIENDKNLPAVEIYLPPSYSENKDNAFPVLYLLHEEGDNPMQWFKMGIAETMDKLIYEKVIPPYILVSVPNTDEIDNFIPWFTDTVIPTVEKQLPVINNRIWRGIAGLSSGGTKAIKIGHAYPKLFGFIGGYSAKLMDDMDQFKKIISETPLNLRSQIFLDVGNEDQLKSSQDLLHQVYTINNWPHTSVISEGAHNIDYWSKRLEYYLVWFGNAFGSEFVQK